MGERILGVALTSAHTAVAPGPIRLVNLTLGYDRHPAVHHLDGVIAPGAALAVCGPNGAGKSTLLKALAGLLAPLGGHIERMGGGPRDVAYLPQLTDIDRSFPIDLRDFVALGATRRAGLFGRIAADETVRVTRALHRVGLDGLEERPIGTLSGGQMQRIGLARALYRQPRLVVLDEPNANLDAEGEASLQQVVRRLRQDKVTLVLVTHRPALLDQIDKVLVMREGAQEAFGPREEILAKVLPIRQAKNS